MTFNCRHQFWIDFEKTEKKCINVTTWIPVTSEKTSTWFQ